MSCIKQIAAMLLIARAGAFGEEDFKQAIMNSYAATFAAMRQAKTKSDIDMMVDAIDAPEWVASLPAGETMTRPEAVALLGGVLAIPAEKRPMPRQQIVYMTETGWNVLVVYWVYRQSESRLIGSLARDTWVRTARGWRRIRHEKFFPDGPLDLVVK